MNDIQETCQKNAAAALAVGRRDVAKVRITFVFICLFFCFLLLKKKISQESGPKCNLNSFISLSVTICVFVCVGLGFGVCSD